MDIIGWITFTIAVLGATTGIASFAITLRDYFLTRPKLTINFSEDQTPFFLNKSSYKEKNENPFPGYSDLYTVGYIPLQFVNRSVYPITIMSICITKLNGKNEKKLKHWEGFKIPSKYLFYHTVSGVMVSYSVFPSVQFPLKVESFDYQRFGIYLPFFDDFVLNKKHSHKLQVLIKTTRKDYKFICSLKELDEIFLENFPQYRDRYKK
ncbi:hypothetical protein [Enterococcus sp. HY326]|uniref:hypothetical protein n=1 Tax=Enterococcus sp. HY326 TaxID=2971265 RepID=UPI0022400ABE|nr:hypothetical protein [Enterococcus sp. HY326]